MSQLVIEDLCFYVDATSHQRNLVGGVIGVAAGQASGATNGVILARINSPTSATLGAGAGGAASAGAGAAISLVGVPRVVVGTGASVLIF